MKSKLLVVFGHYDSRGGTVAIPIEAATEAEIARACSDYNKSFQFDELVADYKAHPENFGWNPTEPYVAPCYEDLLFVAQLWYEGDLPDEGTDLEDLGVVMIDERTDPGSHLTGDDVNARRYALVALHGTSQNFTQLEFVNLGHSYYTEQGDEDTDVFKARVAKKAKKLETPVVRSWNDDAFGFIIGTGL